MAIVSGLAKVGLILVRTRAVNPLLFFPHSFDKVDIEWGSNGAKDDFSVRLSSIPQTNAHRAAVERGRRHARDDRGDVLRGGDL